MKTSEFRHWQHAHCESGVTTNLLRHFGINITEPLSFGIGAGMFFAHIPFLKVSGTPGTTFRTWPGAIFKRVTQRLDVKIYSGKFSSPQKAMDALDRTLDKGTPVGLQTSVFYLPYLPEAFRFHFNAHNLVVFGKENGNYLVSDPVMEYSTQILPQDLIKARFAKGMPEPKGFMYYVEDAPQSPDFTKAIVQGIKQSCFFMLSPPIPWFGNKAISLLARKIARYPQQLTPRKASLYLGNIIRMQEEIGTGGGGFRYLFAAFLQESSEITNRPMLKEFAGELTAIGDQWRNFAYHAARIVKERDSDQLSYAELAQLLQAIGIAEREFFIRLKHAMK